MQANQPGQGCMKYTTLLMMPLVSLLFAFWAPSAIGIYWIFNSVLGLVQQVILYKVMPLPTFTEEDYKAAERELAGKAPKEKEKQSNSGIYSSLNASHSRYLEDFDDDDSTGNVAKEINISEGESDAEDNKNDNSKD